MSIMLCKTDKTDENSDMPVCSILSMNGTIICGFLTGSYPILVTSIADMLSLKAVRDK